MKYYLLSIFIVVINSCTLKNDNRISVSTFNFGCTELDSISEINIDSEKFDSLSLFISRKKPDLIRFKSAFLSSDCISKIEQKGYEFLPLFISGNKDTTSASSVIIKKNSFELLTSSVITYEPSFKDTNQIVVSWFKLKSKESGYIFYLFNVIIHSKLEEDKAELIGENILQRMDEISSGLPVIVVGNFNDHNDLLKEIIISKSEEIYPLYSIKMDNGRNSNFIINDYLKITNTYISDHFSSDSVVNNEVLRFSIQTKKVTGNKNVIQ